MKAEGESPAPAQTVPGGKPMKESRFTVNHVQLTADRPFAEVTRQRSGTGRASGEGIVGSDRWPVKPKEGR